MVSNESPVIVVVSLTDQVTIATVNLLKTTLILSFSGYNLKRNLVTPILYFRFVISVV